MAFAEQLFKLKQSLRSLTGSLQKENSVLGIDIGSAFIKIVQLRKKSGKAVLETYGELALGPYAGMAVGQAASLAGEELAQAFADVMKEANVTTQDSGMSVSLNSSLVAFLSMPNLPRKQLEKMIPIEARKYIPVPITEVQIDWWIIPEVGKPAKEAKEQSTQAADNTKKNASAAHHNKDKVQVLVIAIHNEALNKYQGLVEAAKLNNTFMELEVFGIARSAFGARTQPTMIFDFGASAVKLAIMEYGVIREQHIINRGAQQLTHSLSQSLGVSMEKAEELKRTTGLSSEEENAHVRESLEISLEHIFSEANRVMVNYQRTRNVPIKQVVLTGGGVLLPGLFEFAKTRLETEISFADPFSHVEAPAFLSNVLKDAGPSFAPAVGVALRKLQELE